MTNQTDTNRFQFLFEQDHYIELKDYLYSYILRKIAVNDILNGSSPRISPKIDLTI